MWNSLRFIIPSYDQKSAWTAHALGISPQAVNKAIKEDRLDATEFVGRYFILSSDVKEFAKATGRKLHSN